ncbi:MAG TPA: 30S ribosomal protein S18 [Candidatus Woesebacteria bacterium]|jgi:small subunit ribosomal protein S18|nr:30S ribosomal protein S18 [Candidatus Shapirobacteria bacterium]HOR02048.1 30S ribosomal protein S18 [Candidatus Woesebacteria bacterium]
MMKRSRKDSLLIARRKGKEKGCSFCKTKTVPVWEDYEKYYEYLSPRGRIIARQYTGICARHQRKLVKVIKQARHLGLLPFTTK